MADQISADQSSTAVGTLRGRYYSIFPTRVKPDSRRLVALWLFGISALVVAMVLVGGATRLTDSGLSITEWNPVTGIIPPLTTGDWEEEFAKYKLIPEYGEINEGMSLSEFKFIYWWEWGHRFLGRVLGFGLLIPFIWFAAVRKIERALVPKLIIMFALGGLQGFIGWYMVQSGLSNRVDVSQYRLALHLAAAFFIFAYIFWIALDLIRSPAVLKREHVTNDLWAKALVVFVFIQIILGAFVAGLHAGWTYNTWPLMDGGIVPDGFFFMSPWYINFFENIATVQFNHRMAGYAIFVVAGVIYAVSRRTALSTEANSWLQILLMLILVQIGLGVWTLLEVAPLWLALTHQAGSVLVFAASLIFAHVLRPSSAGAQATEPSR